MEHIADFINVFTTDGRSNDDRKLDKSTSLIY